MKTLLFNKETYEAERIVRTTTDIIGYIADIEIFSFRGINDWSEVKVVDEDGNSAEFDLPVELEKELAMAELIEKQEQDKLELQQTMAEMFELLLMERSNE